MSKIITNFFTIIGIITCIFIVLTIFILIIGDFKTDNQSKQNNYIGKIGNHISVDNSSKIILTEKELQILWRALYKGAPGPILEIGKFLTRRIEILDTKVKKGQTCGSFKITLYTFFNFPFETTEVNYPCA